MSEIWSKMYIGLHVKYRCSSPTLMKLEFSGQFFEKYSNIKFHENPSSGSRVVPCGRTDRRRYITKLIVASFCNFDNAPKKEDSELKFCYEQTAVQVYNNWTHLAVRMSDVASGLGKSEHELLHSGTSMFWPSCQQQYKVHSFTYSSVQ
jgi:hypothetical protein